MTTQTDARETRTLALGGPIEIRADAAGAPEGTVRVEGYAAVFEERAEIAGFFGETIARGAFDAALERGDDVVFLINHDGLPLARSSSGTLALSVDDRGLRIASDLDASDPDVQRIVPKMQRGDLAKMSFAFEVEREEWDETGDMPERRILSVRLHDVAIVTTPAFDGTEIGLRAAEARVRASDKAKRDAQQIARLMQMRLRLAG